MSDDLEQRVRSVVASVVPRGDLAYAIEMGSPLRSIGFDSLAFMELIARLELTFNIQVLEQDLDQYRFSTVSEIMHYVATKTGLNRETAINS
jgi:acyl carrier protein